MTRAQSPQLPSDQVVGYDPGALIEPDHLALKKTGTSGTLQSSGFSPALFAESLLQEEKLPPARRQAFDRIVNRVVGHRVPGQKHLISYLQHLYRRNCRPKTICLSASILTHFLLFINQRGTEYLAMIVRQDIEAFVEHEQDRGLKPRTIQFHLQGLYAFIRFLVKNNVLGPELLDRKIRVRVAQSLPKAICAPDIVRLLAVINHCRDLSMVMTLLRTGMRIGELLKLRVNDVDLCQRTIKIYQGEKNSIGRMVYLSDDACKALHLWLQERDSKSPYLFYGQKGPLGYTISRERFIGYLKKAGLSDKGYTLHCLRHTFATDLLNAGMRLECVQQLLGHTKIEVTRIYARLSDATREEEYFRAMIRIERGQIDEHHGFDCQL